MASVIYIVLAACQRAGLYTQFGFESEAAAWISKQGSVPCAYVGYRRGMGVPGYDKVSVLFGGSNPSAALRRVRAELEKSLEFRSLETTTVDGYPALVMTARVRKRVYNIFGSGGFSRPYMYFEAAEDESTVSLVSSLTTAPSLEYSTDGGRTWNDWEYTTADDVHTFDIITLGSVGDRVYLRGYNPEGLAVSKTAFSSFDLTGSIKAGGNVMSLLDKNVKLTEVPAYGFYALFNNASVLITAPSMATITEIGNNGCRSMYNGCTSLTAAAMPSLTNISKNGCYQMYINCTSLTSAADMTGVTNIGENGCYAMYNGCTSLTSAADMPGVTNIGDNGCYAMYNGCTSLTSAADMPEVTNIGENGCYQMYYGCTSLTAAADMPEVTNIGSGGCAYMYNGCTSLTAAADMPEVTTIGDYGCYKMYNACTSLTSAAAMPALTIIGSDGCTSMYGDCTFNMSDDGVTLNFDFLATPFTAGTTTYSTPYDVAVWMGNTHGFTTP